MDRVRVLSALVAWAVLSVAPVAPVVAAAQTPSTSGPTTTLTPPATAASPDAPPPVQDSRLSPALVGVAVSSSAYQAAQHAYARDWSRRLDALARQAAADTRLGQLAATQAALSADLTAATRRHDQAEAEVVRLRASLRVLGIALYVQGGPDPTGVSVLDPAQASAAARSEVLVDTVAHDSIVALVQDQAVVTATHAQATHDLTGLADVSRAQAQTQAQLTQAQRDQVSADTAVARDRTRVADARLTASVTGTDLTLVVLDAYWRAAARMAAQQPACQLSWPALAGIGRVESRNGTFGGDSVSAAGEEATPIIGIPLDGTDGTQRIADTDGGALDQDPVYDHAVGPMQILPSAWRRYGLDGNGDGQRDPQNLYDAAVAAAVMLCRYGPLDADAGLSRTFFHYNPSDAYVAEVLGYTHAYQAFVVPPVT